MFVPKYRKKVFYEEHRLEVQEILRKLCEWKGVEIIGVPGSCTYTGIDPAQNERFGIYGISERKERDDYISKVEGNMKFAYRNREFWSKRFYVDTVGKNAKVIQEHVANQLKADKEADQLSIFDLRDHLRYASDTRK